MFKIGGAGYSFGGSAGTITGVTAGTGLSGGGTSGSVTIANAGVLSLVAGTGISVSASTGNITVTNTVSAFAAAGSGSELQARSSGTSVKALTGSATSGANLALAGSLETASNTLDDGSGAAFIAGALTALSLAFSGTGNKSLSMPATDTAGDMSITGRAAATVAGGSVSVTGGTGGTGAFTTGTGGNANLSGGVSGTGSSYGGGGDANVTGGTTAPANSSTNAGNANVTGGSTTGNSQNAGHAVISGGNVSSGGTSTAGNVILRPGTGNGTVGSVQLCTATTHKMAAYGATPIVQPSGDVATALGNLGWINSPTVKVIATASGVLTSQTTAQNICTYTTPASDGSYLLSGYVTITAVAVDILNLQVTYTDETNTSRTQTFFPQGLTSASLAATGAYFFPSSMIRVKASATITLKVVFATGTGSVTYDAGGSIQFIF